MVYRDAFGSGNITGEDVVKKTGEGDGDISSIVSRTSGPRELALYMLLDEGKMSTGEVISCSSRDDILEKADGSKDGTMSFVIKNMSPDCD